MLGEALNQCLVPYLAALWQTDAQDNSAHRLWVCSKEVAGGFFAVAERRGREQSGGVGAVPFGKNGGAVAYDVDYIGEPSLFCLPITLVPVQWSKQRVFTSSEVKF